MYVKGFTVDKPDVGAKFYCYHFLVVIWFGRVVYVENLGPAHLGSNPDSAPVAVCTWINYLIHLPQFHHLWNGNANTMYVNNSIIGLLWSFKQINALSIVYLRNFSCQGCLLFLPTRTKPVLFSYYKGSPWYSLIYSGITFTQWDH
jgi:hypothetical protein